jgi:hypothetical protein
MSAAIIDAATSRHASRFRPLPFRRPYAAIAAAAAIRCLALLATRVCRHYCRFIVERCCHAFFLLRLF